MLRKEKKDENILKNRRKMSFGLSGFLTFGEKTNLLKLIFFTLNYFDNWNETKIYGLLNVMNVFILYFLKAKIVIFVKTVFEIKKTCSFWRCCWRKNKLHQLFLLIFMNYILLPLITSIFTMHLLIKFQERITKEKEEYRIMILLLSYIQPQSLFRLLKFNFVEFLLKTNLKEGMKCRFL